MWTVNVTANTWHRHAIWPCVIFLMQMLTLHICKWNYSSRYISDVKIMRHTLSQQVTWLVLLFGIDTDMHEWPAKLLILGQVIFHMALTYGISLLPQENGNLYMSLLNNFFIIHLKILKQRLLCTTLEVRMILRKWIRFIKKWQSYSQKTSCLFKKCGYYKLWFWKKWIRFVKKILSCS